MADWDHRKRDKRRNRGKCREKELGKNGREGIKTSNKDNKE
jgi:hypothetical protein